MALLTRLYQNTVNNEKTKGKFYRRAVHIATLSLEDLGKHIVDHGSPYTEDIVQGVLKAFRNCLIEQLMESKKVKIDGLGTFYLSVSSTGAESVDEASMDQIKNVRLRFLPDSSSRAMLDSVSLRKKVALKDIASLGMSYTGGGSDGGSTGGGGTSGGGNDDEPVVENPGD